jgi:hypothetical protein
MMGSQRRLALVFCALLVLLDRGTALLGFPAFTSLAQAEPPKQGRARTTAGPRKSRAKPKKEPKRSHGANEQRGVTHKEEGPKDEAVSKSDGKGESKALNDAQKLARDAAQGANAQIVKEGDTSVKVMQFTGLDIEGRLKSPQLLYFVSRVHAEFDRPKLPHRSFMPELQRSTAEEPVR